MVSSKDKSLSSPSFGSKSMSPSPSKDVSASEASTSVGGSGLGGGSVTIKQPAISNELSKGNSHRRT